MESGTLNRAAEGIAGLRAATMCEAFQATVGERPDAVALRTPKGEIEITWAQYGERVRRLAAGLHALGVRRGDTVGIMLVNRPEFNLIDTAAIHLGAATFSVYNTSAPEQVAHLLSDAANRVMVTERQFVDVVRASGQAPEHLVVIDGEDEDGAMSLDALEARADDAEDFDFDAAWRAVAPDDVLCLIYTSGTTGPPKGVQLTHGNLVAEVRAVHRVVPVRPGGRIVSFLPAAHIGDRWGTHYTGIALGFEITCCADPRQVLVAVADARPTLFGSVPRVWEKLKTAIESGMASEPDADRQAFVHGAVQAGLQRVRAEQAGDDPGEDLRAECARADARVFRALRTRLGFGECEHYVAGAAATPVSVLEFFAAIGIEILELWGMSETSAVTTINPPGAARLGTVGPALPGIELKLADDREVLVRGPIVMSGYRNQPERTRETFDENGWLLTGDVGEFDDDGYLTIVDRKKELIVNAAGKNMSPANIEAAITTQSPLIGQACAIGDARPYNVALIALDPDGAAAFAGEHGLDETSAAAVAAEPATREAVEAAVKAANAKLSRVEQIKRWHLVEAEWEPGGDELTPTMKLKRTPIAEKYAAEIEALYRS